MEQDRKEDMGKDRVKREIYEDIEGEEDAIKDYVLLKKLLKGKQNKKVVQEILSDERDHKRLLKILKKKMSK